MKRYLSLVLAVSAAGCTQTSHAAVVPDPGLSMPDRRAASAPATNQDFALFKAPSSVGGLGIGLGSFSDGSFWYAEYQGPDIIRFQSDGGWSRVKIPRYNGAKVYPSNVAEGPDGRVWFGNRNASGVIGAVNADQSITEYMPLGPGYYFTLGPSIGSDLWFSASSGGSGQDRVGYFDTVSGHSTTYQLPSGGLGGNQIVLGRDGNLWFPYGYQVGRVTPKGAIRLFRTNPEMEGDCIIAGPDGDLWVGGESDIIERFRVSGKVQGTVSIDGARDLNAMTVGPDGHVWFTSQYLIYHHAYVVRVDTPKHLTSYRVPNGDLYAPGGIATGQDGRLWFDLYATTVRGPHGYGMGAFTPPG